MASIIRPCGILYEMIALWCLRGFGASKRNVNNVIDFKTCIATIAFLLPIQFKLDVAVVVVGADSRHGLNFVNGGVDFSEPGDPPRQWLDFEIRFSFFGLVVLIFAGPVGEYDIFKLARGFFESGFISNEPVMCASLICKLVDDPVTLNVDVRGNPAYNNLVFDVFFYASHLESRRDNSMLDEAAPFVGRLILSQKNYKVLFA